MLHRMRNNPDIRSGLGLKPILIERLQTAETAKKEIRESRQRIGSQMQVINLSGWYIGRKKVLKITISPDEIPLNLM